MLAVRPGCPFSVGRAVLSSGMTNIRLLLLLVLSTGKRCLQELVQGAAAVSDSSSVAGVCCHQHAVQRLACVLGEQQQHAQQLQACSSRVQLEARSRAGRCTVADVVDSDGSRRRLCLLLQQ